MQITCSFCESSIDDHHCRKCGVDVVHSLYVERLGVLIRIEMLELQIERNPNNAVLRGELGKLRAYSADLLRMQDTMPMVLKEMAECQPRLL